MELNDRLEKNFINSIQKIISFRTEEQQILLTKRNKIVMLKFPGTAETDKKLGLLNQQLKNEEIRIFPIFRQIKTQCEELVINKSIDDFEIELILSCWNNDYYIKYDRSIGGNPFFRTYCHFMALQKNELYTEEDWKEPFNNGILPNSKHCYSFHHLYDHTELTCFDLCNIDEIWFEIKVVYQYFSAIK